MLIGDLPCENGTLIVADKMEPPVVMSDGRHITERVADQMIDTILAMIGRIGPGTGGIALWVSLQSVVAGSCYRPVNTTMFCSSWELNV
jgi:hypothetical protein